MIGTFGTIRKDGISVLATRSHAPLLPPPEKCLNIGESILSNFPDIMLARQFEFLTHRDVVLFDPDHPKSLPELEGWIRYVDTRPHDFLSCLFFLDCLPPPVGNIVRAPWFPTLEYTVHFWADPRDYSSDNRELLRCRFSSHHVENGSFYTDAELFSCDGKKLLAKSRQLARIFGAK